MRVKVLTAALVAAFCAAPHVAVQTAPGLPGRLSNEEFWQLSSDLSEADGTFQSDNLLSNESGYEHVVPDLLKTIKPGRVYLGVGPEQNFTYIAATAPAMAFIVDIRRGNLDLQLMYKALFELSADRAEFVSRLFSRARPEGLTATSSVDDIFSAFASTPPSELLFVRNFQAIRDQLTKTHEFALSRGDIRGIEYVYDAFRNYGPALRYSSTGSFGNPFQPTYADLMKATDQDGVARGYLASEQSFHVVKSLEERNMLVPVVGNFAGPKALRAVGAFLKERGAVVSAFYLSNVEQYLRQDMAWRTFCASVATLPTDAASTFIRSVRRVGDGRPGSGLASELAPIATDVQDCGR
ncbi:MAG: hypothetical protein ABUS56_13390 [Acidobacteriota bacterium]